MQLYLSGIQFVCTDHVYMSSPLPLTAGTYITVVADTLMMSPKDDAPDAPSPVKMLPKLSVLGMSSASKRNPCLPKANLNLLLPERAVMYMMSGQARETTASKQACSLVRWR